jgi:drug/metabolite transporter (DMT)-like permease
MARRSWLLMALVAALWGASYLFIKVALQHGIAPAFIVFVRIALGALVLVPIALRAGVLSLRRELLRPIVFVAVVQVVSPFLLIAYGERYVASSLTGILFAAAPLCTVLLALRYDHEEYPRGIARVGVVMGIVGVVLLFGVDLTGDWKAVAGGLMVLLASLGYAVGSLYLKHQLQGARAVGIAASTLVAGAVLLVPAAVFSLPAHAPSLEAVGALLVLGVGGTGIAFAINYTLIAEIGPGRASLVAYIAPACAVFYGVVLLAEPLTVGAILGLGFILGGSWLAAEGRLPGQAASVVARASSRSGGGAA